MIVRHGSRRRWTVIDNGLVNDSRLSFRAKGVAVYLLSKPDGWYWNRETLAEVGPEGEHAMRTAMNELAEYGYLVRTKERNERGQIRVVLTIFECPECDQPEEENRPAVPPGETDETAGGTGGRFTGGGEPPALVSTERPSTRNNGSASADSALVLADFELWWKEYPRRVGNLYKDAARKKYLTLRKAKVPAAALLLAAKGYAREREDEDPQFTTGARNFLQGTDGPWSEALDRARRGVQPEEGVRDTQAEHEARERRLARVDAMTPEERDAEAMKDPRYAALFGDGAAS